MHMDSLRLRLAEFLSSAIQWVTSPQFYAQAALAVLSVVAAWSVAGLLRKRAPLLMAEPTTGAWIPLRQGIYQARDLLFPLLTLLALGIAVVVGEAVVQESWLVRICQSLAVVFLL